MTANQLRALALDEALAVRQAYPLAAPAAVSVTVHRDLGLTIRVGILRKIEASIPSASVVAALEDSQATVDDLVSEVAHRLFHQWAADFAVP